MKSQLYHRKKNIDVVTRKISVLRQKTIKEAEICLYIYWTSNWKSAFLICFQNSHATTEKVLFCLNLWTMGKFQKYIRFLESLNIPLKNKCICSYKHVCDALSKIVAKLCKKLIHKNIFVELDARFCDLEVFFLNKKTKSDKTFF